MANPILVNEKGKRRLLSGHPWVFLSDLTIPEKQEAGIVSVCDLKKRFLGKALYSPHSQISVRMLTSGDEPIDTSFWEKKIRSALALRQSLQIPSNAWRLIYGEADGIPSFVLDRYDNACVFQSLSAGVETQRETLLSLIQQILNPSLLVERNDVSVRTLEKLPLASQVIQGDGPTRVEIKEGELRFVVDLLEGQKTGAFLDQRQNRIWAGNFAKEKQRVLDACSYQGWFACHLARAAKEVIAIEQSEAACRLIEENATLNQLNNIEVIQKNVFDVLREMDGRKEEFDLINLDPPAFVKSRSQLAQAIRGYKELNLRAMKLLQPGGILITSSCSHHLSEEDFLALLSEAARDAKRKVQILWVGGQDRDHPMLLGFPESKYLKCLFLRIM